MNDPYIHTFIIQLSTVQKKVSNETGHEASNMYSLLKVSLLKTYNIANYIQQP